MAKTSYPLEGSCRCGQTRIEISSKPLVTSACHCRGCQKMSSSAFSLTAIMPAPAFRVLAGEPVVGGAKGPELDHYCCPDCMTWMFTRIKGMENIVNVRTPLFDDPDLNEPFIETQTAEKLSWANTPAKHSFERFPSMEHFQKLIDDYAGSR
jgi:hypothetical protein